MRLSHLFGLVYKFVFVAILTIAHCESVSADDCEICTGREYFGDGRFVEAFLALKDCESSPKVTADTLKMLAFLYYDESISGVTELSDRASKVWELMEAAALTGDKESIEELATMYEVGDSDIGFGPDFKVADCLLTISASPAHTEKDGNVDKLSVQSCLATKND